MKAVRRPVVEGQKLSRFHDVDISFDDKCKICNITDGTLLYNIHFWRFNLGKTYKEIIQKVNGIDPQIKLNEGNLVTHFKSHFPVDRRAALEVVTGTAKDGELDRKLTGYFEEKVREKVKPAHEIETLYGRVSGWLDSFEESRIQNSSVSKDDIDPLVRLSSEMRGLLGELNRMRQADTVAKFCVQGFMSRFVEYLLRGLPEEIEMTTVDIEDKIGGGVQLKAVMEKLKRSLGLKVKDSARDALVETCKEFGLK
jgi:hypothetical protein